MQNCGMPPLCNLGKSFEHKNGKRRPLFLTSTKVWVKTRTKFEWRPFFWSSPNVGQKNRLILGKIIFILIFVLLKFSEVPGPPFSKSCVRYWRVGVLSVHTLNLKSNVGILSVHFRLIFLDSNANESTMGAINWTNDTGKTHLWVKLLLYFHNISDAWRLNKPFFI